MRVYKILTNISEIATPTGTKAKGGIKQGEIKTIKDGEIVIEGEKIVFVGTHKERLERIGNIPSAEFIDLKGCTAIPGFVDPHTHLPWYGSREDEFALRLKGISYMEIASKGGGILRTVNDTRSATLEELKAKVIDRLDEMLEWGTTTCEAKSGYGLSLEAEIKQLQALKLADEEHPIEIIPTLLAAHEVPKEYKNNRRKYIDIVVDEITPEVVRQKLAKFADVFCENGVFSEEEAEFILSRSKEHGLVPRIHADEFVNSGGARVAAKLKAASADHLTAAGEEELILLKESGVVATLLPGTSFFLRSKYAQARKFVNLGIPVAIATDCNPGSSYTESMPMIITLAVLYSGLTIEEALTASTLNAAHTLRIADRIGTLEEGKQADITVLRYPSLKHLGYHYGINPVAMTIKKGTVVFSR